MHLDEEQVQRLLAGELALAVETSFREHLAGCPDCRARLVEAGRDANQVDVLLRNVDHPPPRIDAEAVAIRARTHRLVWSRWAAGMLLTLGLAGVAYAAPGSPLPAWLKAVVQWVGADVVRLHGPPPAPAPQAPVPSVAGIAVAPGRALLILFTAPQVEGLARVSLTDGAEVVVRASAGAATFTSDAGRLTIDHRIGSSATYEIQIPRAAPRVEIRVGGSRMFLKDGGRVTTASPADAQGVYLLSLTPPG